MTKVSEVVADSKTAIIAVMNATILAEIYCRPCLVIIIFYDHFIFCLRGQQNNSLIASFCQLKSGDGALLSFARRTLLKQHDALNQKEKPR